MKRLPDFIVIGAMKCATTTLHAQLEQQPGVAMWGPGEPAFFSDDDVYARGLDWYSSLFHRDEPATLWGERSTAYTKLPTYPDTVARMHRAVPAARLIYVMRHPVDRLISHYMHEWILGEVSAPIQVAVEQDPQFVAYGCYDRQLAPYLQAFGPSQVLPVFFERLLSHPQESLERICSFIGYAGVPTWRSELGAHNVSLERTRRGGIRDRILSIPLLKTLRRRLLSEEVRDRIKGLWRMKRRPELPQEQMEKLIEVFDQDLSRLGTSLGVELTCANFRRVTESRCLEWVA